MMKRMLAVMAGCWLLAAVASAEPVRNGNDLLLQLAEMPEGLKRTQLINQRTGIIHTFRFLKITDLKLENEGRKAVLMVVEPASGYRMSIVVVRSLSLKAVRDLKVGDCMMGQGRITAIFARAPDLVEVDPMVDVLKDKAQPVPTKEYLRDIDPRAH